MKSQRQTTIRDQVIIEGIGVHSGARSTVTLNPAEAGTGIIFSRVDQDFSELRARATDVQLGDLSTVLGDPSRGGVATVEHLMAALFGLGVDNCFVEVDGPELPILDGSAITFVDAIESVGIVPVAAPRRAIKVLKPLIIEHNGSVVEIAPYEGGLRLEVEIDFGTPLIGRQAVGCDLSPSVFRREIARARTFGFMTDVSRLWAAGRALGASLDNTVVLGEGRVLNPEGLRWRDEFVRHKMLDAIGDLGMAGLPIIGKFKSFKGGHRLNVSLVRALLADTSAYRIVEPAARRERGHADLGMAVPAYRADAN